MLQSFTKKYTDLSTEDEFAFIFYCDVCDKAWKSVPIPFSQRERKSFFKKLFGVYTSLWNAEHKDAFERANREGMLHLTAALSVTGGFVMTIFPKKKIVVPTVARNDSIK